MGTADNAGNHHVLFKTMFQKTDIPDFELHIIYGLQMLSIWTNENFGPDQA